MSKCASWMAGWLAGWLAVFVCVCGAMDSCGDWGLDPQIAQYPSRRVALGVPFTQQPIVRLEPRAGLDVFPPDTCDPELVSNQEMCPSGRERCCLQLASGVSANR